MFGRGWAAGELEPKFCAELKPVPLIMVTAMIVKSIERAVEIASAVLAKSNFFR